MIVCLYISAYNNIIEENVRILISVRENRGILLQSHKFTIARMSTTTSQLVLHAICLILLEASRHFNSDRALNPLVSFFLVTPADILWQTLADWPRKDVRPMTTRSHLCSCNTVLCA
jgi:hypothetical protein